MKTEHRNPQLLQFECCGNFQVAKNDDDLQLQCVLPNLQQRIYDLPSSGSAVTPLSGLLIVTSRITLLRYSILAEIFNPPL